MIIQKLICGIFFLLFISLSWSTDKVSNVPDSIKSNSQMATVQINPKNGLYLFTTGIIVHEIDGSKRVFGIFKNIQVPIGNHTILLQYEMAQRQSTARLYKKILLDFTVVAGRTYQVKMKLGNNIIIYWIEDSKTGNIVSKLHLG